MLANEVVSLLNSQTSRTQIRTPSPEMDKHTFLILLTKQLANQDPLDPMSSGEFVSQLAQFSSLEQAMTLNANFERFMAFQQLTQATSLIGKTVVCLVYSQDSLVPVSGVVEMVMSLDGQVYLKLSDGSEVELSTVISVQPTPVDEDGDS